MRLLRKPMKHRLRIIHRTKCDCLDRYRIDGSALDAISFVDGDASDNNGPCVQNAESYSFAGQRCKSDFFKALDDRGNGTTASVVSALQYAIDSKSKHHQLIFEQS